MSVQLFRNAWVLGLRSSSDEVDLRGGQRLEGSKAYSCECFRAQCLMFLFSASCVPLVVPAVPTLLRRCSTQLTDIELGFPAVYIINYWKQKEEKKFAARMAEMQEPPLDYAPVRDVVRIGEHGFLSGARRRGGGEGGGKRCGRYGYRAWRQTDAGWTMVGRMAEGMGRFGGKYEK